MSRVLEPYSAGSGFPANTAPAVRWHAADANTTMYKYANVFARMQLLPMLFPPHTIARIPLVGGTASTAAAADALTTATAPFDECAVFVNVVRRPLYLSGKYLKHVRGVPQSPWVVDGVRRSEHSVEELIAAPIMKYFGVRRSFAHCFFH